MSYDTSVLGALLAVAAAFIVIVAIVLVVEYIFFSIAMYTMAKNRGITHAWLAWIPIVHTYLFGELIFDKVHFGTLVIPAAKWVLLFAPIVIGILGSLISNTLIMAIISIFFCVYLFGAYYRLFKLYSPNKAVLFLVLSIFFSFLAPIFLFAIRKAEVQEYLNAETEVQ